jgi:hypothetical protein
VVPGPPQKPDRSHLRDYDEVLMQRTAALQGIEMLRINVGPKSNQITAIGNSAHEHAAVDSRGVDAATAASTHAGHKVAEEEGPSNHRGPFQGRTLHKKISLRVDSIDQLNFEFKRNKHLMNVFTIRLRRVYQA